MSDFDLYNHSAFITRPIAIIAFEGQAYSLILHVVESRWANNACNDIAMMG